MTSENQLQTATVDIKKAASELIDSFHLVCEGLIEPMSQQFMRYRINEIENSIKEIRNDLVTMQAKILDLSRNK
jgi:hypothetical protein